MISICDFDVDPYPSVGAAVAAAVRQRLEPSVGEMAELLGQLVTIESPSDDPAGLNLMAARLADMFGEFGDLTRHPANPSTVDHLRVAVDGAEPHIPHALALCHYDTVWPSGTIARMPFAVDDRGVITGPGCFDMKGGIVLLWYALRELRALGVPPRRPVRILLTADEEVGSVSSRELITTTATGAGVALVFEAPLPGGTLKTARKGTANYRIDIEGKAAHAGIEPERGASAVVELAHQVIALHALNDYPRGTTLNVGVARGGTRLNVVPAQAELLVNIRAATVAEAERIDAAIHALTPVVPGTALSVTVIASRPPMERTAASGALFERAKAIAAAMGVADLGEGSTGGGSDGNFAAAMGIPTLDGLGPEGGGAHADDEHVLLESLPRRAALVAGLLAEV